METAKGNIGSVVVVRMDPGEDLLKSLEHACIQAGIKYGTILTGIGSLQGARFFTPVRLPHKKAGYGYGDPITLSGPIELLGMSGTICQGEEGNTLIHAHYSLSDARGNAYGGHVIEGNTVLLTAECVIGEIKGLHMGRMYQEDLEVFLLHPQQN